MRSAFLKRETKETQIEATLSPDGDGLVSIETPVKFFNHLLEAFFFHGKFSLTLKAAGDVDVDAHHLVEDCGIVLGKLFAEILSQDKKIVRFASVQIPMDEALSSAVVDFSGRGVLVFNAQFPQPTCGDFDIALIKEFLYAFCINGGITLHAQCLYGDNGHHMAEALFKAIGRAMSGALKLTGATAIPSTKGSL